MLCDHLRHLLRSRAVTNPPQKIPIFVHACGTCSELPSNIKTMVIREEIHINRFYSFYEMSSSKVS